MQEKENKMEKIISLCKRRGFVFPGSEIYGGLAGTYTYGQFGSVLKNKIRDSWLNFFVTSRDNMYLIDAPILMQPKVWEASGHTSEFIDPLVECQNCKKRYRADHLLNEERYFQALQQYKFDMNLVNQSMVSINIGEKNKIMDGDKRTKFFSESIKNASDVEENVVLAEKFLGTFPVLCLLGYAGLKTSCPNCGKNEWGTQAKKFNLMLETKMGAVEETAVTTYLRPEEAQSMFVHFKDVLDSSAPKIPFGIAQIGKAFRNEITPRDFTYRMREFEIVEFEYFIHPEEKWGALFDRFLDEQKSWLESIGIPKKMLHPHEHDETSRAHYSKKTVDLEFEYPFGIKELTGLSHRGNYDLKRHQEFSGQSLEILDEKTKKKYIPHVLEPTVSLDRAFLALLCASYTEDEMNGEVRSYLKFKPRIAPVLCAVSPLLKNKQELVTKAKEVYSLLKKEFGNVMWDDNGNIGKRYRRQDEIGTPWCIVIDFDTLGEKLELLNTVTVRDRDTGNQERVAISDLIEKIKESLQK